ncbi:alpha/beta hydrolase [Undibacterium pigrum]|uniref:alpha/beta hydrolase n=1 Tax=Undibacterium pigrum TaxID=401470 RepID=UPI0014728F06|nr:alpha/beta hydrolase [Undibacterium pigrum]
MKKRFMLRLMSGLALCGAVAGYAHAAAATTTTKPCRLPDFPQEVQCGQIQRPLNPAQPQGKQIDIHYVVVPSQDRNKLPDAVFLLAGGPGQSAISVSNWGTALMSRLNRRRDLVFVDQRGTGRSAPLECPALEKADEVLSPEQKVKMTDDCMRQLQTLPYGELQYFSTSIAMQDLEAVRLHQGYGRINLVGASYGTRAGLEYLRQYPQSVRRIVLDGVVPPSMRLASSDAQKALDALFTDCVKEPACNTSYPDLANRWKKLLASQPQKISMLHPRMGTPMKMDMTRDGLLGLVHKTLYNPNSLAALPYALTQAEQGNYAPLITMSGATALPGPGGISYGMHFSVWCGEAFAQSATLPANDDFEKLMAEMYTQTCKNWPRAEIPAAFFTIPQSASPALLLSGGLDPVTPTRHGTEVAKALGPKALHVQIENTGHGLLAQGCVRDVVHRFLNAKEDSEAIKLDTACVRQIPRALAWQAPVAPSANKTGKEAKP